MQRVEMGTETRQMHRQRQNAHGDEMDRVRMNVKRQSRCTEIKCRETGQMYIDRTGAQTERMNA